MSLLPLPRNAAAITAALARGELDHGDCFVVSFVGSTTIADPHVYVDPGRRYDWGFAANLQAAILTRPGVSVVGVLQDLFDKTRPYPTLIDVERQRVASIVDGPGGRLQPWPLKRGSEPWRALFG